MADMQKFDQAVDQVILDSERLHTVVNGDALTSATAEDGSLLPSIRKALVDNLYFKTPLIAWSQGTLVREYNQLYLFTDSTGRGSWWYAPTAMQSKAVQMGQSPMNDPAWRVFADSASLGELYAPITSPIFKGNPQANTPVKGDDTNSLATTEFVTGAVADLKAEIGQPSELNTFENLTVTNQTLLNKLRVTGDFLVDSPTLLATNTVATFNTVNLSGPSGRLTFIDSGTNPGATKTDVTPWKIATHELVVDEITAKTGEFGTAGSTDLGLTVHGQANIDYLHVTGNGAALPGVPRLVVDGITQLENLTITGTVTGLKADVDGLDIKPKSVTADTVTTGDMTVHNDLTVSGKTIVQDLEVQGEITGITLSVDGKIISPRQVNVTTSVGVGTDLSVDGVTTVNDLRISGTVTGLTFPDPDVTGLDITPRSVTTSASSTFAATTTVQNLVVTGTVEGLDLGVDGKDIGPKSVTTDANVVVGENLEVDGTATMHDTTVDNLTVNMNANVLGDGDVAGTLTVNNLVVTGTATGDFGGGGTGAATSVDVPGVFTAKADSDEGPATLRSAIPMDTNGIGNVGDISTQTITATSGTVDNLTANHIRVVAGAFNANGATTLSNLYSIQNITLTGNAQFSAPAPQAPFAENYILYLVQDATGGRVVSFGSEFVPLNDGVVNTAPNSITVVQVIYRGTGTLYDLVVTPRP